MAPDSSRQSQEEADGVMPAGLFSGCFRAVLINDTWRALPTREAAAKSIGDWQRATVTDELDRQVRVALQRRRRSRIVPIALIVFAISASGCAYLWVTYGDQLRTAVFATAPATGSAAATTGEQSVNRADFDTFERQTAGSFQSAAASLEAQKADLKKLSGLVADLAAKVDALRNAAATAPTSAPIQNSISAQPVASPRSAAITPRKTPQGPKSPGPISVGGAPLPPAPSPDR
jgi:hypothetical protein